MVPRLQVHHLHGTYWRIYYLLCCRDDEQFTKLNGKRKAFHKGGNSSCRFHIRQHYKVYKKKCDDADIPIAHWAIPRPIWKAMEEAKEEEKRGPSTKKKTQQLLDFKSVTGPREFTRARTLEAVTKLIATNNQVCVSALHSWKSNSLRTYSPLHLPIIPPFGVPLSQ